MKKVLFLSYDGKEMPGAKARCYDFAEKLSKLDVKTEVFSFKDDLNASYHGPYSRKTSNFERLKLLLKATKHMMKEDKQTIIFVHKAGFHCMAAVFLHWLKGNKLIMDYDDYEYESSLLSKFFFNRMIKNSEICIAASRALEKFLKTKTNKPVFYLPAGTDAGIFKPKKTKKNKKITFAWVGILGDKDALDNVLFILDCFEELNKKVKNVKLELRADGPYSDEVKEKISTENIKNVEIIGWVKDLSKYLSRIHIGLIPLVNKNMYNASKSPGKFFQYMSMELPVICTDYGEPKNIISNGETGLIAKDKSEFIKSMILLAKNSSLRKKLGQNARKLVLEKYDQKVLVRQLKEIINSI